MKGHKQENKYKESALAKAGAGVITGELIYIRVRSEQIRSGERINISQPWDRHAKAPSPTAIQTQARK